MSKTALSRDQLEPHVIHCHSCFWHTALVRALSVVNQYFRFTLLQPPLLTFPLGSPAKLCTRDRVCIQLQSTNLDLTGLLMLLAPSPDPCPKALDQDLSLAHLKSIEHQLLEGQPSALFTNPIDPVLAVACAKFRIRSATIEYDLLARNS